MIHFAVFRNDLIIIIITTGLTLKKLINSKVTYIFLLILFYVSLINYT